MIASVHIFSCPLKTYTPCAGWFTSAWSPTQQSLTTLALLGLPWSSRNLLLITKVLNSQTSCVVTKAYFIFCVITVKDHQLTGSILKNVRRVPHFRLQLPSVVYPSFWPFTHVQSQALLLTSPMPCAQVVHILPREENRSEHSGGLSKMTPSLRCFFYAESLSVDKND